jgi:LemA protein
LCPDAGGMGIFSLVALGLAAFAALYLVVVYNQFVKLVNLVAQSWKQVDVELQRRYDLVPNLVRVVKGSTDFEKSTLINVVEARKQAMSVSSGSVEQRGVSEKMLGESLKNLFALAESYPVLATARNYLELQLELANTEDRIAASRNFYNINVRDLNTKVGSFPDLLVAKMFKFCGTQYFETDSVTVHENTASGFANERI